MAKGRDWMARGLPVGLALMAAAACGGDAPTGPMFPEVGEPRVLGDHREIDIRFESGDVVLAGTVFLPPDGTSFPAAAVNPGSSWDARATWGEVQPFVLGLGAAVLVYDKRGFGGSGGVFFTGADEGSLNTLAGDLAAAADALESVPLVDRTRIGLFGSSQGGWVVPLAANLDRTTIRYAIVTVGGAVSVGQEGLYDELTGFSECERSALTMEEIVQRLRDAGPSGFDPRASLEALEQPAIWIYGGLDFSHPALYSAEKLAEVRAESAKDWTVVILENANHELVEGGTICQQNGPLADVLAPLQAWMGGLFTAPER